MTFQQIKEWLEIVAFLGVAFKIGHELGEMRKSLDVLSDGFKAFTTFPERIVRVEAAVSDHERRLERGNL